MSTEKSYDVSTTYKELETDELYKDINIKTDKDVELAKKIDLRLEESKSLHKRVCAEAEDSMNVFRGRLENIADAKANKFKDKSVLSRVFFTVRNLVGMATDTLPFVEIIPDNDNPKSIKRAKSIAANIEWQMIEVDFQTKLAQGLFDAWIKRDAYFHWFWNYEKDDIDLSVVELEDLSISPEASDIQEAEYVIYHPWKNRAWWKKHYPKKYDKIKFEQNKVDGVSENSEYDKHNRGNVARLIAYWENDILIEKVKGTDSKDIILRKGQNPNFEYRSDEEQKQEFMKSIEDQQKAEEKTLMQKATGAVKRATQKVAGIAGMDLSGVEFVPIRNYFISSRKPFVQLPSIRLSGELYSESVTKQVREVFLSMNEKKRAYADNLRGCNQKIVVDSNSYTKTQANKITDEPNQVLRADFSENPRPVYIEKGGEVPASFHADIAHDEKYIDDLYGNHEISRGTGKSNTLGQDQMNFQSDRTPIRFQSRATERAILELVQGWLQLMRLFYTKKHYAKKWGEREGLEIIELINEDIEEGVKPHIKPGSMITVSREEKAARAMQLFTGGGLDPYTMFVELDMPNPAELADRLVNWIKFGIISAEEPETVSADMNGSDPAMQTVERANQENEAFQMGDNVPPTPPEYISPEHVKMHYAFLGDKTKKMDDEDVDNLRAHAEVDKATLSNLIAEGKIQEGAQASGDGNKKE